MKKLIVVLALVLGTLFLVSPAQAVDTVPAPEAETTTQVAVEEPVAETPPPAPVEEKAPEPKVEKVSTPEPTVQKPIVEPTSNTDEEKKITFCHNDNNLHSITTSLAAFFNAGHIDHSGDIFPAGSYNGQSWSAQGDQDVLANDCQPVEPPFDKYEVTVCWQMDNSDGVEGTYEWPQHRVDCNVQPKCDETIELQVDKYWIENKDDEDYLAGLEVLNSPADDAQLSPHDYYSDVREGDDCVVVPPKPEPIVTETSSTSYECGDDFQTTHHVVTTIDWVYDEQENDWNQTEPVVVESDTTEPVDVVACPTTDKPTPPKDKVTPVVNTDQELPSTGGAPIWLLFAGGVLLAGGLGTVSVARRRIN